MIFFLSDCSSDTVDQKEGKVTTRHVWVVQLAFLAQHTMRKAKKGVLRLLCASGKGEQPHVDSTARVGLI